MLRTIRFNLVSGDPHCEAYFTASVNFINKCNILLDLAYNGLVKRFYMQLTNSTTRQNACGHIPYICITVAGFIIAILRVLFHWLSEKES